MNFLCFILIGSYNVFSQNYPSLYPYLKGQKYGYVDSTFKLVIPIEYDEANPGVKGIYIAVKNKKHVVFNEKFEKLFDGYDQAFYFRPNHIWLIRNDSNWYYDIKTKVLNSTPYNFVDCLEPILYHDKTYLHLVLVTNNNERALLDLTHNKLVIEPLYANIVHLGRDFFFAEDKKGDSNVLFKVNGDGNMTPIYKSPNFFKFHGGYLLTMYSNKRNPYTYYSPKAWMDTLGNFVPNPNPYEKKINDSISINIMDKSVFVQGKIMARSRYWGEYRGFHLVELNINDISKYIWLDKSFREILFPCDNYEKMLVKDGSYIIACRDSSFIIDSAGKVLKSFSFQIQLSGITNYFPSAYPYIQIVKDSNWGLFSKLSLNVAVAPIYKEIIAITTKKHVVLDSLGAYYLLTLPDGNLKPITSCKKFIASIGEYLMVINESGDTILLNEELKSAFPFTIQYGLELKNTIVCWTKDSCIFLDKKTGKYQSVEKFKLQRDLDFYYQTTNLTFKRSNQYGVIDEYGNVIYETRKRLEDASYVNGTCPPGFLVLKIRNPRKIMLLNTITRKTILFKGITQIEILPNNNFFINIDAKTAYLFNAQGEKLSKKFNQITSLYDEEYAPFHLLLARKKNKYFVMQTGGRVTTEPLNEQIHLHNYSCSSNTSFSGVWYYYSKTDPKHPVYLDKYGNYYKYWKK